MNKYIDQKVIVITGAAGGFGRLVSTQGAALGARLVCADVNAAELDVTVETIIAADGAATGLVTDVTDLAQMQALAQHALDTYGRIDVWINNAGTMPLAFHADYAQAMPAWNRCIDINFKGVMHGICAVHDIMINQGQGHVINLSSIYSNFPVVGAGVYGATKAAVNFLSDSLRVESQGKIKVTVIKPTGVPGTNLGAGVVNRDAIVGILGQNAPGYLQQSAAYANGELPPEAADVEHIEYFALAPEYLAEQIIHVINQPWGVNISEITVRAAGDAYIL
jgi:NADP-dependent 3-hydroxy acid dehydrogenase YdfG